MKTGRVALCLALLAAGCNKDSTSTTTTPAATPTATSWFSGSLTAQGTSSSPTFAIANAGTASITLVTVTSSPTIIATSVPVSVALGVGLGTLDADGVTCDINPTVNTIIATPSLATQLSVPLQPSTICVQVFDPGNLGTIGTVNFVVRIVHT